MPVQIKVKNFQSIADAELTVDKFTVVTGSNNSGKSSLCRAVQGVFSNPSGDAYVRHGTDKLSVQLSFDDGQTVCWEKGPKVKPTYMISGKTLHPGRGVPDEVSTLGVRPIQVGQQPVWPQLAQQFVGQVFLLDLPGSSIAEAVADVDRVGKLTQALRFAETDKRAVSSEIRVRRQDVDSLKRDLDMYAGLDTVAQAVSNVEVLQKLLTETDLRVSSLQDLKIRWGNCKSTLENLSGVREVQVPVVGLVERATKLSRNITIACDMRQRIQQTLQMVDALSDIRKVSIPASSNEAVRVRDLITLSITSRVKLQTAQLVLDRSKRASHVAQSFDFSGLAAKITKAMQAEKVLSRLLEFQSKRRDLKEHILGLTKILSDKTSQLGESVLEIKTILGDLGECPTCGTVVPQVHLHGGLL